MYITSRFQEGGVKLHDVGCFVLHHPRRVLKWMSIEQISQAIGTWRKTMPLLFATNNGLSGGGFQTQTPTAGDAFKAKLLDFIAKIKDTKTMELAKVAQKLAELVSGIKGEQPTLKELVVDLTREMYESCPSR